MVSSDYQTRVELRRDREYRRRTNYATAGLAAMIAAVLLVIVGLVTAMLSTGNPWPYLTAGGMCYGVAGAFFVASAQRRADR